MVSGADNLAGGLLALSDRGAGVPLRELALVGLTAAIITYFATGPVRVLATHLRLHKRLHLAVFAFLLNLQVQVGALPAVHGPTGVGLPARECWLNNATNHAQGRATGMLADDNSSHN